MSACPHYWTVSSECPLCLRGEVTRLTAQVHKLSLDLGVAEHNLSEEKIRADGAEAMLDSAYAEINKQVFGSRVVFDRAIVKAAERHHCKCDFTKPIEAGSFCLCCGADGGHQHRHLRP